MLISASAALDPTADYYAHRATAAIACATPASTPVHHPYPFYAVGFGVLIGMAIVTAFFGVTGFRMTFEKS